MVYVAGPPAMQMALGGACHITAPSPPTNHGCLPCERMAEIENSAGCRRSADHLIGRYRASYDCHPGTRWGLVKDCHQHPDPMPAVR